MAKDNKIRFGFKNVYYAKLTETEEGITYEAPKRWAGAKSLSLDASGETSIFYADDIAYFTTSTSNGYSGSIEMAYLSDQVKKDIFNWTESSDGMLLEVASALPNDVALIFECQGDVNAKRHLFYRCTFGRPSFEASTKEESVEPQTESLDVTMTPISIGDYDITKATATKGTEAYENIFTKAPILPTVTVTA